jgi:hypothetical protein
MATYKGTARRAEIVDIVSTTIVAARMLHLCFLTTVTYSSKKPSVLRLELAPPLRKRSLSKVGCRLAEGFSAVASYLDSIHLSCCSVRHMSKELPISTAQAKSYNKGKKA